MATVKITRPKYCIKCDRPIVVTIPADSIGNAHGEMWHPCSHKDCELFGKEVELAIIKPIN